MPDSRWRPIISVVAPTLRARWTSADTTALVVLLPVLMRLVAAPTCWALSRACSSDPRCAALRFSVAGVSMATMDQVAPCPAATRLA